MKKVIAFTHGDYTIFKRPKWWALWYLPGKLHIPLGQFDTLKAAKAALAKHVKGK